MQRFQRDSGTISWSGWRNRAVLLGMAAALIGVVLHAYVLTEAAGRWVRRAVLVGLLAVLAAGLWASPEASSAEALDFGDSPTAASVISGDENRNVVKVVATGPGKQSRVRYAVSGHDAFAITPRTGRVIYDGSAIDAGSVQLTVTAHDRRRKFESAMLGITVTVNQPAPQSPQRQLAPQPEPAVTPPAAPANFSVRASRFDGLGDLVSAVLSWDDPENDDITGWELKMSPAHRDWGYLTWTPIPDSGADTTSVEVKPLRDPLTHTFQVRAVNGEVTGAASTELTLNPSPRPTNFKVTPIAGGFTLSWDEADEHAGIEIVGWESHWAVFGWTPWERVSGHSVSDGTITLTITHETDDRYNPYLSFRTSVAVRPIYQNGQRGGHAFLEFDSIAIPRPK